MLNTILIILFINLLFSFRSKKNILYCGIVAFSGHKPFNTLIINLLLLHNVKRGKEGTGIWNQGEITKDNEDAGKFLEENKIIPEKTFIGHTRMPSVYSYSRKEHTHPFKVGTIISVHNGKIESYYQLLSERGLQSSDYDVDSEALTALLNNSKKDKFSVLKEIKGKASLVWVDEEDPSVIYAYRKNNERPLFRGESEDGMYICSTEEGLKIAGISKIKEFKTETIYKIQDGKVKSTTQAKEIKKKITPQDTPKSYSNIGRNYPGHYRQQDHEYNYGLNVHKEEYTKPKKILNLLQNENNNKDNPEFNSREIKTGDWIKTKDTKDSSAITDDKINNKICLVNDVIDAENIIVQSSVSSKDAYMVHLEDIAIHYQIEKQKLATVMHTSIDGLSIEEMVFVRSINTQTSEVHIEKIEEEWEGDVYIIDISAVRELTYDATMKACKEREKKGKIIQINNIDQKENTKKQEQLKIEDQINDQGLSKTDIQKITKSQISGNIFFDDLIELYQSTDDNLEQIRWIVKAIETLKTKSTQDNSILSKIKNSCIALRAKIKKSKIDLNLTITKIGETE